jgi:phage terminase large subunit-like protein
VHDELGQVRGPRSELYEALETAAGAQESPLSIVISTQAPTSADLLSVLIDDAATKADPKVKLFLYSAPETLDPFSEKAIKAANPAYGDFLNADEVRQQAEAARRMPSQEAGYRNLILNQRVNQQSPLVARRVWESCGGDVDDDVFRRNPVWMGLDLSARNDLTALALIARDDEPWCGTCGCTSSRRWWACRTAPRATGRPMTCGSDRGLLTATPGASVDYAFVAAVIADAVSIMDVRALAFDRWRIDVLKAELARIGIDEEALTAEGVRAGLPRYVAGDRLARGEPAERAHPPRHAPDPHLERGERDHREGSGRESEDGQVEGHGAHRRPGGARDGDRNSRGRAG